MKMIANPSFPLSVVALLALPGTAALADLGNGKDSFVNE
jgi:hypothetical protein